MTTWETDAGDVLPAGASVGGFTVRSVLGAGGFGVTYLAWDERLAKLVAVKEYFPREWGLSLFSLAEGRLRFAG